MSDVGSRDPAWVDWVSRSPLTFLTGVALSRRRDDIPARHHNSTVTLSRVVWRTWTAAQIADTATSSAPPPRMT